MIKLLINNVGGQGTYAAYSVLHVPTRACKGGQTRSVDKERPPARHTKASLVTELPVMELDINISFLAQYYSSSFSRLSYQLFFPRTDTLSSTHEPRLSLLPTLPSTDQPVEFLYFRNAAPGELLILLLWPHLSQLCTEHQ